MGDGAHLGVTAGRALKTVLGGEPSPQEEERMTDQEFANWIMATPFNLSECKGDDPYTDASRWLARRYFFILLQAPAIDMNTAWEVFKTKWPQDVEEAGGMTGFMHGWAWNAARHTLSMSPQPNPAIPVIGPRKPTIWERIVNLGHDIWARRYDWLKIEFQT